MQTVTLLGPQRLSPFIGSELVSQGITGPVAAITAGWQEREDEDEELREEVRVPVHNLRLYSRWDDIRRSDQEYFQAHRSRQDRLRQLRSVYQRRLNFMMDQAHELLNDKGAPDLIGPELDDAIRVLQQLDDHYLSRVHETNRRFQRDWRPLERPAIARHREEVMSLLAASHAVLIAGGHIAVLLNRLRLFDLSAVLRERPVFGWSAGAMVLTSRIVLFHDSPPQGRGHAEVFESGLGLIPGVVVLPSARHRLNFSDRARVRLMSQRLAPSRCVPMDEDEAIYWDGHHLTAMPAVRCLCVDGVVSRLQEC
jgi:hypothetical protein